MSDLMFKSKRFKRIFLSCEALFFFLAIIAFLFASGGFNVRNFIGILGSIYVSFVPILIAGVLLFTDIVVFSFIACPYPSARATIKITLTAIKAGISIFVLLIFLYGYLYYFGG